MEKTITVDKKFVTIIILSVLLIISIGFNIWFTRTGSVDHANKLRETISKLEHTVADLSAVNAKQGEQLNAVLSELWAATDLVTELRGSNQRALELARIANERLINFERAMAATGTTIDSLIARQRLIDEFVRELWEDNKRLREALGISNTRN